MGVVSGTSGCPRDASAVARTEKCGAVTVETGAVSADYKVEVTATRPVEADVWVNVLDMGGRQLNGNDLRWFCAFR